MVALRLGAHHPPGASPSKLVAWLSLRGRTSRLGGCREVPLHTSDEPCMCVVAGRSPRRKCYSHCTMVRLGGLCTDWHWECGSGSYTTRTSTADCTRARGGHARDKRHGADVRSRPRYGVNQIMETTTSVGGSGRGDVAAPRHHTVRHTRRRRRRR
eukprot:3114229-Prymnesium_polylepis.2